MHLCSMASFERQGKQVEMRTSQEKIMLASKCVFNSLVLNIFKKGKKLWNFNNDFLGIICHPPTYERRQEPLKGRRFLSTISMYVFSMSHHR